MPATDTVLCTSGTHNGEPVASTMTRAAGRPKANRRVVSSTAVNRVATSRPSTVPAAHSVAAPNASRATATSSTPMDSGSGKASSQAPISAGTANQAKDGRSRSCSRTAAPTMAITGWNFWMTAGVTGSPNRKDSVNSVVATAEAPTPIATTASLPRRSSRAKARRAARQERQQHQDQHGVFGEDDGRRGHLLGQRQAQQRIGAPQGGGKCDDPGQVAGTEDSGVGESHLTVSAISGPAIPDPLRSCGPPAPG